MWKLLFSIPVVKQFTIIGLQHDAEHQGSQQRLSMFHHHSSAQPGATSYTGSRKEILNC
jgi:hypothetical protein